MSIIIFRPCITLKPSYIFAKKMSINRNGQNMHKMIH